MIDVRDPAGLGEGDVLARSRYEDMILVTGASGFIGRGLVARMTEDPRLRMRAAVRREGLVWPKGMEVVVTGDISPVTEWRSALTDVEIIVHAAARVHVMRDFEPDQTAAYRRTMVAGTLKLAQDAASGGVRRFIFLSSIKVNGECTAPGCAFSALHAPEPTDQYGLSKLEEEEGLRLIAADSGMELVIIRPVLVYGPGVAGNFLSMMRWITKGVPLPLGAVDNRRSLVARDNLVDLIVTCFWHPAAASETFLVSDGDDLSTPELLERTAFALGRRIRLVPVPARLLRSAARLVVREDLAARLCDSLQVDIGHTRAMLNWSPPVSMADALVRTAEHYLASLRAERSPS